MMKSEPTARKVSEEVVHALREQLQEQASAAGRDDVPLDDRVEAVGLCLESVAALEAAGASVSLPVKLPAALVSKAIESLDPEALKDAADELAGTLHGALNSAWDEEALSAHREQVEDLLLARQRVSRRLQGAMLLRYALPDTSSLAEAVEYFDALIRPLVWQLAFTSSEREGHALMIQQARRADCWWWCEALDVDWETIRTAATTAELLERFPTFANYFAGLRSAAAARLRPAGSTEVHNPVAIAAHVELGPGESRVIDANIAGLTVMLEREDHSYQLCIVVSPGGGPTPEVSLLFNDRAAVPASKTALGRDLFVLGSILPESVLLVVRSESGVVERSLRLR